ncbi:hypothetical protein BC624_10681 [Flavobacterium granuli]|uniref:Uncharacterized protein n=1 Tax=Flavobacterium granuli TaxID=280093 RepID=A0A1M5RL35_9FLAO|nr:hypothetical protein BC624_10681 [Flavobacterium granuli]SHH26910.1 hypothetical protein SAMN05443373_11041 [Flavobacterium granuli]
MVYYCFLVFMNLRFHCLKIQNLKTTSKLHSALLAVRLSGSACGTLPFRFSLFIDVFNLRADSKAQILIFIRVVHADDEFVFEGI